MANIFKNMWDNITGKNDEVTAGVATASQVADTSDNVKSTKDLYGEGSGVASTMANNAAGIAGANAKANAMMNGGSRMAAALAGAKAAGDASINTYNGQINNAATLAQGQNQLLAYIKQKKAEADAASQNAASVANASNQTSANASTAANKANKWTSTFSAISNLFN